MINNSASPSHEPMTEKASPASLILVVEDDEHISDLLTFLLERQGYRVQACRDGREARAFIEATALVPAMVLLDVMLPFIDGFELVGLIRGRPTWKAVPVVMLTAKTTEADIVRALDAGADDYIVKPFQPNELMARVRRYVR
jgi:two-component system alkaline phosphatase synthesis response regulator PhoP